MESRIFCRGQGNEWQGGQRLPFMGHTVKANHIQGGEENRLPSRSLASSASYGGVTPTLVNHQNLKMVHIEESHHSSLRKEGSGCHRGQLEERLGFVPSQQRTEG